MELKSCRCCDSNNVSGCYHPNSAMKSYIRCNSCGFIVGGLSSNESLIEKWNARFGIKGVTSMSVTDKNGKEIFSMNLDKEIRL